MLFGFGLCAQPFIDPVNIYGRYFNAPYKKSMGSNYTTDYNLSLCYPREFKNGNTLLVRLGAENIQSTYDGVRRYTSQLYSLSLPVGMQFLSGNKRWKYLAMAIPKVSSDLRDDLSKDLQLGGMGLVTYVHSDRLKLKLGLYYSPEFWGSFFMPLVGLDYRINERWSLYGTMPSNYRVEYNWKHRLFTGLGFKSFQRSYRLSAAYGNDYVRMRDTQVKLFLDYYLYKKLMVYLDVAYGADYSLVQYNSQHAENWQRNPIYSPVRSNLLLMLGVAYRIRFDAPQKL